MKKWIIISWDLVTGKGTALGEFTGMYEEAALYAKNEFSSHWGNLTLCGVIE